ncbi:MAG: diguanylate cyclase [Acidobacteriota bacterium]
MKNILGQSAISRLTASVAQLPAHEQEIQPLAAIQIFAKIFETTQEGIMITDKNRTIVAVNPAFTIVTGYCAEEVIGKNPRLLQSGRHSKEFYQNFWQTLVSTGSWQGEIWNRRKNGEVYPEWLTISTIKDSKDAIINYVGVFSDITVIKRSEYQLAYLAHHDALTGLPNRILFNDRLNIALANADRNNSKVALIFVDLDRFKQINDSLGHHIGDLLLQTVAERLRSCVREGDTVARLGGDEFTVILPNIPSRQDATRVTQKILDAISQPFMLAGHKLTIGASIGISLYPVDNLDANSLLQYADAAMYQAKQCGGNRYSFFDKEHRK